MSASAELRKDTFDGTQVGPEERAAAPCRQSPGSILISFAPSCLRPLHLMSNLGRRSISVTVAPFISIDTIKTQFKKRFSIGSVSTRLVVFCSNNYQALMQPVLNLSQHLSVRMPMIKHFRKAENIASEPTLLSGRFQHVDCFVLQTRVAPHKRVIVMSIQGHHVMVAKVVLASPTVSYDCAPPCRSCGWQHWLQACGRASQRCPHAKTLLISNTRGQCTTGHDFRSDWPASFHVM